MAHVKHALRSLAKTPFVTTVAVLSLALGIGANAAIFSLFEQTLLRPLPVEEPERLVNLSAPGPKPGSQSCNQAGDCEQVFSYAMFRDLQEAEVGALRGVAAHRAFSANLSTGENTRSGSGMLVSGSYFPLLGLRPAVGRLITPADDRGEGAGEVAVLSHGFWEEQLGADPGVVGDTLVVNGRTLTVIGVAPKGFRGTTLGSRPDVFVPLSMRAALESFFDDEHFEDRRTYWAYVFARLAPGATVETARAELGGVYRRIVNEVEAPLQEGMSAQTLERFRARELGMEPGARGQSSVHEEANAPLTLLFAITGVVLLIACANIANLLLARGANRSREMAIRSSLGAGRGVLLRQLLTESSLLAALGGAAGVLVAYWTLRLIGLILPPQASDTVQLEISLPMVVFAGGVALATGLLFGLYPALQATRPNLVSALGASGSRGGGSRAAARFRNALVTVQIALSMALLVAAGLFVTSLTNVGRVDLGLEEEGMVTFQVSPALNGYEAEASLALFERLEEELAAVPGVTRVSGAMVPILSGSNWNSSVQVEGFEGGPDVDTSARLNKVAAGHFQTLGVPVLAGRELTAADREGAARVAVVNEAFARKFGLDPRETVGTLMSSGGSEELDTLIVGLVADAHYSDVKAEIPAQFFTPYRQDFQLGFLTFYLRTATAPETVMAAVPRVVHRLDPNLPVEEVKTLETQVRENLFLDRMIATLSAAFALLATLLAAIGLYGVLAYSVSLRTREIGVQMALGAGRGRVLGGVMAQMGRMVAVGGVLGVLAALALGRAAGSLLFGLSGTDPAILTAGLLLLAAIALAAAYLPAHRASRVEPMEALRYE